MEKMQKEVADILAMISNMPVDAISDLKKAVNRIAKKFPVDESQQVEKEAEQNEAPLSNNDLIYRLMASLTIACANIGKACAIFVEDQHIAFHGHSKSITTMRDLVYNSFDLKDDFDLRIANGVVLAAKDITKELADKKK